jgi:hypothetical protein
MQEVPMEWAQVEIPQIAEFGFPPSRASSTHARNADGTGLT